VRSAKGWSFFVGRGEPLEFVKSAIGNWQSEIENALHRVVDILGGGVERFKKFFNRDVRLFELYLNL
jgi:hypothetical protein